MTDVTDIRSIVELEAKLSRINLVMDEVAPECCVSWLDAFAASNGTTKEMLLCTALATTSALVGNSVLHMFGSYEERGNLFIVITAPSGTGKTPACQKGVVEPIVGQLEEKIGDSIMVDETSSSGLFNHYVSSATVPILCVDEGYSLLNKLVTQRKSASQTTLSLERLCKLYDGDYWYVLKGQNAKRMGVQTAKLALLAYTTPHGFLESIWPKIVDCKNGLSDRILLFHQERLQRLDLEQMAERSHELDTFTVKSFATIFESIYMEHDTKPAKKYTLSAAAKEMYFKFNKPNEDSSQPSSTNSAPTSSKKYKNTLRIAMSMHVLYNHLTKALSLECRGTPTIITAATMQMAINFIEVLETMKGIADLSCKLTTSSASVQIGVTVEDIKKRMICLPGPFTTARRVVRSFSSTRRPTSKTVQEAMTGLESDGIGSVKAINKLVVFLKKIPTDINSQAIAVFGVTPEEYRCAFLKKDEMLTSSVAETVMETHPQRDEVEEFCSLHPTF